VITIHCSLIMICASVGRSRAAMRNAWRKRRRTPQTESRTLRVCSSPEGCVNVFKRSHQVTASASVRDVAYVRVCV